VCILVLLILPVFFFGYGFLHRGLSHPLFSGMSFSHLFQSSFDGSDGAAAYLLPNICFIFYPFFHPGFIFIGCVLFFFFRKNMIVRTELLLCLLPVIFYLFFLGMLPAQNVRLETLVFPMILVAYFPAFESMMGKMKWHKLTFIIIAAIQLILIASSMKVLLQTNKTEAEIAAYLRPIQKNYSYIYQLGNEGIVRSYDIDIIPLSLYADTISSVRDSSLLLLRSQIFEKQWQGKLPAKNLDRLKEHAILSKLKTFGDGWDLYVLLPRQ